MNRLSIRIKSSRGKGAIALCLFLAPLIHGYAQAPTISSFAPGIGTIGTSVTINGTNFSLVPANNVVKFNGTTASVSASSNTSITTDVPTGATTGNITVTVGVLTGTSATTFKVDVTPPQVISNLTPSLIAPNSDLVVSANFQDDLSGIANPIRLQYRPVAGILPNNFITVDMTPTSASSASATIPAGSITELGVEYKFELTDGVGNSNMGAAQFYNSAINYIDGLPFTSYPATAAGGNQTNYRIVAIPLVLDNKSANNVFSDEIGAYDSRYWRMFRYNGTRFIELDDNSILVAGEGYWFIALSTSPLNTGVGTSLNINSSTPFQITLQPGWNQIGNPYNFNISWSDVLVANPSVSGSLGNNSKFRVYRGTSSDEDVLKKMEGGFVKNTSTSAIVVRIPTAKNLSIQGRNISVPASLTNSLDAPNWEVIFKLKAGNAEYGLGGFGMRQDAQLDFDTYDDFNLPRFLEYLEIKYPKERVGMTFTKDIVPTRENFVWEFSVESNLKESTTSLAWDNSYFGTSKDIYLLDVAQHRVTDMKEQGHYQFDRSVSKVFKVVFGDPAFAKHEILPSAAVLYDPYPNPFTNQVTVGYMLPALPNQVGAVIEILNAMGEKVAGTSAETSGAGNLEWRSEEQASGLYIVKLKYGNQVLTRKLLKQ